VAEVVEGVLARKKTLVYFQNASFAQGNIGIDDVGIVGFEPWPVSWRNLPAETWRDQTETANPTTVAVREDAIQGEACVFAVLDQEGDAQRPRSGPAFKFTWHEPIRHPYCVTPT